ncbi:hypothetical protein YPPY92_4648, partial [Yersinia pestis PY-92]
MPATERT